MFARIEENETYNQLKVLRAFSDQGVSESILPGLPATATGTGGGKPWTKSTPRCLAGRMP